MTVLRGAAWVCALVAGTLVGGCTAGEPEPTPITPVETRSSSSAPETSEPTVAAPELPAEAMQQTPQGAAAFAQYWVALMNYAYATGDTAPLEAATDPQCSECQGLIDDFTTSLDGGNRLEGGRVSVSNVVGGEVPDNGLYVVTASFEQEAATSIGPSGNVVESMPASAPAPIAFYSAPTGDSWLMRRVVAIQ